MKSLSTIAKYLDVSVAILSYVYNDKWRETTACDSAYSELATR